MVDYTGITYRLWNFLKKDVLPSGQVFLAWPPTGVSYPTISIQQINQSEYFWLGRRTSSTHVGGARISDFFVQINASGPRQRDKIFARLDSRRDIRKANLEKSGIDSVEITNPIDLAYDEETPLHLNSKRMRVRVYYLTSGAT